MPPATRRDFLAATSAPDPADAPRTHRLARCPSNTLADLDTLPLGRAQPS